MIDVRVVGRLTKDPTFTQTNSGVDLSRFSIASKSKNKDENGERKTDFIQCVAWRGIAESIMQYCKKGDLVSVVGSLSSRYYESADGGKQLIWEITVTDIEYLSTKADREKNGVDTSSVQQKMEPIDDDNLPF